MRAGEERVVNIRAVLGDRHCSHITGGTSLPVLPCKGTRIMLQRMSFERFVVKRIVIPEVA